MGNCVTVYKNKDVADMDLGVRIQSPIKEKNVGRELSVAGHDSRSQNPSLEHDETSFRDMGKAGESFFDSQPWLDSDCDDFFSVNGDSVSSSGNSPNHQKSFRESSIPDQNRSLDCAENAVPADTKKLLIELFRESFDDDEANNDPSSKQRLENKPSTRSPYESTPNSAPSNGKPAQSAQRCLPSLVRNMSFGERKKRLSPAQN
ncbi:hypothetical protein HRI_002439200 [Hibiscus trionum]|uniref:Uncharacterized protein n=1 Tax=Hibiscus trionum TaxID=183268 RepID=A0A9W7I1P7_HIBTR|nr:hypothetical protein HRI_002439200 [Hibiscus trionum]